MKPAAFDYHRAESLEDALAVLAEAGDDARVLAGGQSLLAMLNMRMASAEILLDIARLPALAGIERQGDAIRIGATTRQAQLEAWADLAGAQPLLAQALPYIGHFQTRARGTVGGSLAHADPSSELPLCLVTLGGSVELRSTGGDRMVAAEDFLLGPLTTACEPTEMITAVHYPSAEAGAGYGFGEMARRHGDFAIVALAAVAGSDGIRLGVGGVADRPVARSWPQLAGSALDDALHDFARDLEGHDDIHATASYRRRLVHRLGRRVIAEAQACRG